MGKTKDGHCAKDGIPGQKGTLNVYDYALANLAHAKVSGAVRVGRLVKKGGKGR